MKRFLFPTVVLIALTSCGSKPELRKDIKEFVSNFSLKGAMDAYQKGGYTYRVETNNSEGKVVEYIEMEFSYLDALHPSYTKTTTNYVNDVETSKEEIVFVEQDEKYYISTNGELEESSLDDCSELIKKFFYEKTQIDGEYHTQGWYYGDYLLQVAPVLQKYITIDQENELYLYSYEVETTQGGSNVTYWQNYSVNKLGMLVENHVFAENKNESRKTDIYVHD